MQDKKNISDYNTFRVFEEMYGQKWEQTQGHLDQPEDLVSNTKHSRLAWLSFIIFVFILGFAINPLLSYYLKTPYPLVVIAEDSMQPSLKQNDLVLAEGIAAKHNLKLGDVVLVKIPKEEKITVLRVQSVTQDRITLRGDSSEVGPVQVYPEQVLAKVVGHNKPLRLPVIGKLAQVFR